MDMQERLDVLVVGIFGKRKQVNLAFAQNKVSVRQIGKRFQQDARHDVTLEESRIELVQLENGQIGFQIVKVLLDLVIDIVLKQAMVLRVVPKKQTGLVFHQIQPAVNLPFNALQHLRDLGLHSILLRHV